MRTTLTIDDDLAPAIEQFRAAKQLSLKQTVNLLLRQGLQVADREELAVPYRGPVFHSNLKPGIDPTRMNQIADEIELESFIK